jgi:very-short-patch-repair endonuclease
MTLAEQRLWSGLRAGQVAGVSFRRRQATAAGVVDFVCPEAGLVIEIDGPAHPASVDAGFARQRLLERTGFQVLRFTHGQVFEDLDWVLGAIRLALDGPRAKSCAPAARAEPAVHRADPPADTRK